jgi:hypothetical protein
MQTGWRLLDDAERSAAPMVSVLHAVTSSVRGSRSSRSVSGLMLSVGLLAIAAVGVMLLLIDATSLPGKKYSIATWAWPVVDGSPLAPARALTGKSGLLAGQTNADGTACFWLGDGESRETLMWPPGYTARSDPLRAIDDNGHVAATVGEFVSLDGATAAPEAILGKGILGCRATSSVVIVAP